MPATKTFTTSDLSPVWLSYSAALRGVKPRLPGTDFTYLQLACGDAIGLMCLAASNPEGIFYGVLPEAVEATKAQNLAAARQVKNVIFLTGTITQLLTQLAARADMLPLLDYVVCDPAAEVLSAAEQTALFALTQQRLKPSGILAYHYRAYSNADEILRFLVSEFAPAMNVTQAKEFLEELKNLAPGYFKDHPIALAALDRAISKGVPDEFFSTCEAAGKASSGTYNVMADLLPRSFAFAGDADVSANYMELSVATSAQPILENCRQHLLYEPIKDFAMQRLERTDIWCRLPVTQTANVVELFGGFTYGLAAPSDQMPVEIKTHGKSIDLSQAPFANLIELMKIMPVGIGDFLSHPFGKDVAQNDALLAVQILVATGVIRPMRGGYEGEGRVELSNPQWNLYFNNFLDDALITTAKVVLASPVVGSGIAMSARDALVIQAIHRVGLANSAGSLMPELQRLAKDPQLAAQIMDVTEPTEEMVNTMIHDVVNHSMVRWYAYGLLAA